MTSRAEPGPEPPVSIHGVEVRIDGRVIITGIDWRIEPGERWAVLGPNGCGKTTLMRVVGMALHPSKGTVTVLGGRLGAIDVRKHRHQIGVVSAAVAASLRPEIEAVDVVMTALHGALAPWWHEYTTDDRERAMSLLARFGIEALAEHQFGTLSSGERQRTLLARALMSEPRLLVLDEPATGLDLGARERLLHDLATLADDPTSPPMIIVTHHLEEIPGGVTHAMLMRAGRIVSAGPIATALTSSTLSTCFDLPLVVGRDGDRWWARSASVSPQP